MLPFVLQTILLLVVIGGVIAYSGNYIGRRIGKKRLTIFNLRPRHTAISITVFSGILIALSTLAVMLAISQDARTALLGLEALKNEIRLKTSQLETMTKQLTEVETNLQQVRSEASELQRTKARLSKRLEISSKGQLIFRVSDIISFSLIQAGPEKEKIEQGLKGILSAADDIIRRLGVKGKKHLIYMAPEDFDQVVEQLLAENKLFIVKLVATRNVLFGDETPAKFELLENRLVYKNGEAIAARDIPLGLTGPETEQEIMKLLTYSHQLAKSAGLLPDPGGSLGSIPYAQISDLAKKIKANGKPVTVKALASKDIFLIGPLDLTLRSSYK